MIARRSVICGGALRNSYSHPPRESSSLLVGPIRWRWMRVRRRLKYLGDRAQAAARANSVIDQRVADLD
jgi:hypothetical protein